MLKIFVDVNFIVLELLRLEFHTMQRVLLLQMLETTVVDVMHCLSLANSVECSRKVTSVCHLECGKVI